MSAIARRFSLVVGLAAVALASVDAVAVAAELPALRVNGQTWRDATGKTVVLRGFNLGNWLVNEIWMTPVASKEAPAEYSGETRKVADHVTMWRVVQERFGVDGRKRLQAAWRDAWLRESDFRLMKEAGLNSVRLPFIAENLLGDDPFEDVVARDPKTLKAESLDWSRLDQALAWAETHGIYVVLDMHGAPGRQSVEHHTGRENENRLWTDPKAQALAEKLWSLTAAHVKGNNNVAALDLLNEPRAIPGSQGEDANAAKIHAMHDRLYKAVRAADPGRVVAIEDGFSGFNRLPQPNQVGWRGVVYSYHAYPDSRERLKHTLDDWEYSDCKKRGVPFYIGEWNLAMHPKGFTWPDDLKAAVAELDAKKISWSAWNFKVVSGSSNWRGTNWGWYRNEGAVETLDLWRDDLETLIRKTAGVATDKLQLDPSWRAALAK